MSQQVIHLLTATSPHPNPPPEYQGRGNTQQQPAEKTSAGSFVGHAKLISILTLLSRILGMARESVVANYFGATVVAQAFSVAFSIPNLFRKLLGEGALSAAFIPLYAQAIKSGDEKEARRFAGAAVNMLGAILVALTVAGEAILWVIAEFGGLRSDNLLVVKFTAIMLPYVILVCGTAFLSGILQVHKRFGLPALTQVPLNLIHIGVIVIGARILYLHPGHPDEVLQTKLAYWLCFFVLIAGGVQITMLLPALREIGFEFLWVANFRTPAIRRLITLSIPVALSASVLQVSVLLDKGITLFLTGNAGQKLHVFGHAWNYPLAIGAAARLNWAQMLYQFPLGVFATAVATAIFPSLSTDAHDKDGEKFKRVLRQGILFTLFESLAASLGLIIVREPTVRLLFQRGSFTALDTHWVALSVAFYSGAIWAFSLQQILNRAYYALHDTVTPLVLAVVTIAVNTVVEVPLAFTKLGEAGIAAGTLASFAIQAVVMLVLLDRRIGGLGRGAIAGSTVRMLIGCAAMGAACWGLQRMSFYPHGNGHWASAEQLGMLMVVGAAAYVGVCMILGLRIAQLWRKID
jgi:putative peptidoglycan lipid II flippase